MIQTVPMKIILVNQMNSHVLREMSVSQTVSDVMVVVIVLMGQMKQRVLKILAVHR